jgi:hypothetical protein
VYPVAFGLPLCAANGTFTEDAWEVLLPFLHGAASNGSREGPVFDVIATLSAPDLPAAPRCGVWMAKKRSRADPGARTGR